MAKPEKFVYICVNERPEGHPKGSCTLRGGREVLMAFAKEFEQQDLFQRFALVQTGCMGPCFEGPIAAVFPDNVFYRDLAQADAAAITKEHLLEGKPLVRKVMEDRDWK